MNRLKELLIFLVILLMTGLSVSADSRMVISEPEFNFGYIPQNSLVAHVFWLHSTGDKELKITKVDPGCGCTEAPLDKNVIPPGDSARLEIVFSTKRYSNRIVKKPLIYLEGRSRPRKITIISYITTSTYPLVLKPYQLNISQFGETLRDRATFELTNVSGEDLSIKLVSSVDHFGTLSMPSEIGAGETITGEIILNESVLGTSFVNSFTFELSDEHSSRYTIPVKRKVRTPKVEKTDVP